LQKTSSLTGIYRVVDTVTAVIDKRRGQCNNSRQGMSSATGVWEFGKYTYPRKNRGSLVWYSANKFREG